MSSVLTTATIRSRTLAARTGRAPSRPAPRARTAKVFCRVGVGMRAWRGVTAWRPRDWRRGFPKPSRDVGDAELGFCPERCHKFVVTLSPLLVEKLFPDLLLGLLEGQRSAGGAFHQLDDVMTERGGHRQARFSDLEGQEHLLKLRHRLALFDEP